LDYCKVDARSRARQSSHPRLLLLQDSNHFRLDSRGKIPHLPGLREKILRPHWDPAVRLESSRRHPDLRNKVRLRRGRIPHCRESSLGLQCPLENIPRLQDQVLRRLDKNLHLLKIKLLLDQKLAYNSKDYLVR
jgi:hypothetical protein